MSTDNTPKMNDVSKVPPYVNDEPQVHLIIEETDSGHGIVKKIIPWGEDTDNH